jgi:RHS repeat-associated protein
LTRAIAYDNEHRVTSIQDGGSLSEYTYGADRQRLKKTEDGVTTYYFFANYEEVWSGGSQTETRTYYLANDQKIAQRITQAGSETLSYVHADHLGSSVKLTDETGQVIQTIAYEPYGESVLSEGAAEPSYQYTGQEKDAETGLYYYGARYYDAELGRFIQADALLDGLNRYAYSFNNPLKYVDATGSYVVDPDTDECFGGDCDHYPGYDDFDPKTLGDNDEDGNGIDDDVDLFVQVTNNILGESWQGGSDQFEHEFEGLSLALQYVLASGGQSLPAELGYKQYLSLAPTQGKVISFGYTGGLRLFGIGLVQKVSIDLVIDAAGRGQFYFTQGVGYWGEGLLNGNEDVIKLAEHMTAYEKIPQGDSFMVAGGFSFTVGIITSYQPFHVNDYEGLGQAIDVGAWILTYSKAVAFDPNLGPNGQWIDQETNSVGLSAGLPVGLGHYPTESVPISEAFWLEDVLGF